MVDDAIRSMERALAEGDRYVRGPLTQLRQRAGLPGAFADVFLLSDRRALASFDELDALVRRLGLDPDAPTSPGVPARSPVEQLLAARAWVLAEGAGP